MRIGIDATITAQTRIVGISRFIVNLVIALGAMPGDDEYYLCYRLRALRHPRCIWRPQDARFHIRLLQEPLNRRLVRRLDVYHATDNRLPRYYDRMPFLGTLYDIFYLSQPEMGSVRTRTKWQARYRDLAARAQMIMTISEFSKAEIVRLLGVPQQRVRVVPLAASDAYVPQSPEVIAAVRHRYGLERPYILFGGGFERRKNPVGAVRVFARALPRLPAEVSFALAGTGGPLEAQVRAYIRDAGLTDRVQFLGFIPDRDHPALISGCLLYFFPTLLEGFGLPALEAMACATPLLASSTTSLPEICGDAALLVDPSDEAKLADALVELATNGALRAALVERGLRRAREFTWRRVAEQVHRLYHELG
jgi:glycosyltransferase involved in cell wall biosynthesis